MNLFIFMSKTSSHDHFFHHYGSTWWDEKGPLKLLHHINPKRIEFILDHLRSHYGITSSHLPLTGLKILDIGCGGGILSEPLSRLGATVTGIDALQSSIHTAQQHAQNEGLDIHYECTLLETMAMDDFDVIIASEVIEHVDSPEIFIHDISKRLRPNGCCFITTFNRTLKSYVLGILVAENVLGWAPKGSHEHEKFVKPSELAAFFRNNGITLLDVKGLTYSVFQCEWRITQDTDVNYFAFGVKS